MRDKKDDPPASLQGRPQTWLVERPLRTITVGPSGFNPHPRSGYRPRRPPPLIKNNDGSGASIEPFAGPASADRDTLGGAINHRGEQPARLMFSLTDVNQITHADQDRVSSSTPRATTETRREDLRRADVRPRRKSLVSNKPESSQLFTSRAERMPSHAGGPGFQEPERTVISLILMLLHSSNPQNGHETRE